MQPLGVSAFSDDRAVLTADTDPGSIEPFVERHRWSVSRDGAWRTPLTLQFKEPLPGRLLRAVGSALVRFPEVELYAYGDADPTLSWLADVAAVEHLSVNLACESLEPVREMTRLRTLALQGNMDGRLSLGFLSALPWLEELYLSGYSHGFEALADLPVLRELRLYASRVKTFDALRGHPALETLAVSFGAVRDFSPLATIPTLRGIGLWQIQRLTAEHLESLAGCSHLEAVSLGALRNVEHLGFLTGSPATTLRFLILERLRRLGSWADIAGLPALQELAGYETRAADGRLQPLLGHPALQFAALDSGYARSEVEQARRAFTGSYLGVGAETVIDRGYTPRVGWRAGVAEVLQQPRYRRACIPPEERDTPGG